MLNIYKHYIIIIHVILLTSLALSQTCDKPVCVDIQNVDAAAGTLDIYMVNQAGCTTYIGTEETFTAGMDPAACATVGVCVGADGDGDDLDDEEQPTNIEE